MKKRKPRPFSYTGYPDIKEFWCDHWDGDNRVVMTPEGMIDAIECRRIRDWLTKAIEWVEEGEK